MIGKLRSVVLDTTDPLKLAGDRFRVFQDPAGHTFCLVWGIAADGV